MNEGIRTIQAGVESWADAESGQFPKGSEVSPFGLLDYVDTWPLNPYTDAPMTQGTDPGDFYYSTDGHTYVLTGYGDGGKAIITVP